ncbi:MAG: DUF3007 family protein [Prochlorococcaceae cyanobacterium]
MTRAQAILIGLLIFGLGAGGYGLFQASGLEGFSAGIAASAVLVLIVLGWTASYLFRVVSGNMTYMQQRRTYRTAYDEQTSAELERKFAALSPEEQERLLREVGQWPEEPTP